MEEIVSGALYIVSTPIGNLSDITYRAIYILRSVDLIAAEDTRTTSILLNKYEIKNSLISFNSVNQNKQIPLLIQKLNAGNSVALVSDAGTPGINDPAYQLVKVCIEERIRLIPIPGASAFLAAAVVSGLPINQFVFEGFLPTKKGRQTRLKQLCEEKRTIILYESPHRIERTVNDLIKFLGNRQCVMGREITKKFEEFYRGDLFGLRSSLEQKKAKGEIVLLLSN